MIKYVPNVLSILRLIALVPLIILTPFELPFMIIYVVAGLTDMIDGPIARRFNVTSPVGAKLDSIADLLLVLVVVFRVLPLLEISTWLIVWIFIAIAIKAVAAVVGFVRHKQLVFLHTYANKLFIFGAFLFPVFYSFMEADGIVIVLLTLAMFAFLEETYINATSAEIDLNDKGVLFRSK